MRREILDTQPPGNIEGTRARMHLVKHIRILTAQGKILGVAHEKGTVQRRVIRMVGNEVANLRTLLATR